MPHMIIIGNKTHPRVTGTLLEFYEIVGRKLGRCVNFVHPASEAGILLPNGTWTGSMGQLTRNETDISPAVIMSATRASAFDFSEFIYMVEHSAGYTRPVVQSDIVGFIKPFSPLVWLVIGLSLVAMFLSLFMLSVARGKGIQVWTGRMGVSATRPSRSNEPIARKQPTENELARDAATWTFSSLIMQSVPLQPPKGGLRVLTGLWLLLGLTLSTVYKSNLKAMLILPKIVLPFDNIEELANSNLPVWLSRNSVLHEALMLAEEASTYGRINKMLYLADKPNNVPVALQDFFLGRHVLMAPSHALTQLLHSYFSKNGKCNHYLVSENFLKSTSQTVWFQKGSPLKAKVDPIIRNLREFGILDQMYRNGVVNATECIKPISSTVNLFRALTLEDFFGVFCIYAIGVTLACVIFVTEMCTTTLKSAEYYPNSLSLKSY